MNFIEKMFFKKSIKTDQEISEYASSFYYPSQAKPYNPDVLVRQRGGLDIYRNMMIDDQVKAVMAMKLNAILSPGWSILSSSESEQDKNICDFISFCLVDGIHGGFKKALTNILSSMIYGYSVSEKIYTKIEKGQYTGKIGIKNIKTRPAHSFYLHTDNYNELVKIEQSTTGSGTLYFMGEDLNYFIVHSYHADNTDYDNIYGTSDLRATYRAYFSKDNIIKFLNIYLERFGMGIVQGKYPRGTNKKEVEDLTKMVNNISSKTSFVTPEGVNFEILEGKNQGQSAYIDAIKMYDTAIARSVLVPNLMGFSDMAGGAYNLGEKHFDLFMMVLENIQHSIEELVNSKIIKDLVDLNFGNVSEYPEMKFNEMTKDNKIELFKMFMEATTKGIVKPTEEDEIYAREILKMPRKNIENNIVPEAEQGENIEEFSVRKFQAASISPILKKINFKEMKQTLNIKEDENALKIGKIIAKMKDDLTSTVIRRKIIENKNYDDIEKIDLKFLGDLRLEWKDILRKAFRDGQTQIKKLLSVKKYAAPMFGALPPKEALAFFERKAFWLAGAERDYIVNKIKPLLYDGIKAGLSTEDVIYNLEDFFSQYEVLQRNNQGKLEPIESIEGRLNTVVRTNYIDAYNQGNITMMKESPELVPAFIYSAILDDRTTDICESLDGKIYKANNPIWNKITPPNHFNCRSLILPVLNDEWDGEEDEVPSILPGKGFGG